MKKLVYLLLGLATFSIITLGVHAGSFWHVETLTPSATVLVAGTNVTAGAAYTFSNYEIPKAVRVWITVKPNTSAAASYRFYIGSGSTTNATVEESATIATANSITISTLTNISQTISGLIDISGSRSIAITRMECNSAIGCSNVAAVFSVISDR